MTENKSENKVTIGVVVDPELKSELSRIAEKERRSLSGQAEFFLRQGVRQMHLSASESEVAK